MKHQVSTPHTVYATAEAATDCAARTCDEVGE